MCDIGDFGQQLEGDPGRWQEGWAYKVFGAQEAGGELSLQPAPPQGE